MRQAILLATALFVACDAGLDLNITHGGIFILDQADLQFRPIQ